MNSAIPAPMSTNAGISSAVRVKAAMNVRLSNRQLLTRLRHLRVARPTVEIGRDASLPDQKFHCRQSKRIVGDRAS